MSGSVTDLKDAIPLDERDHAQDPVFPPADRNSRRDQVVGEREWVIEQVKEKTQECPHQKKGLVAPGVTKPLPRCKLLNRQSFRHPFFGQFCCEQLRQRSYRLQRQSCRVRARLHKLRVHAP